MLDALGGVLLFSDGVVFDELGGQLPTASVHCVVSGKTLTGGVTHVDASLLLGPLDV